ATASSTLRPRVRDWTVPLGASDIGLTGSGGRATVLARSRTVVPRYGIVNMRFAANVSILFKEAPFLERFGRAAAAGLTAVEFWWPPEPLDEVEAAIRAAGLEVALFNFYAGDMPAGDRGLPGDPDRH